MSLRLLGYADLAAATGLLEHVGLASGVKNVARYLAWQPDGLWGEFDGPQLLGMVTLLHQGPVGFVGCMAVHASVEGRGMGRRLLEHAQAVARRAGITTFLLEATPAGERLYTKLGYVTDYESLLMSRTGAIACELAPIARSEHPAVVALDRAATGCDRDVMIGSLAAEFPGRAVHAGGTVAGYGLVVGERLGPVIARDPAVGRAIVDELAPMCHHAAVAIPNEHAMLALADHGFTELRRLRRMRLGPPVAVQVDQIWTYASAGAG